MSKLAEIRSTLVAELARVMPREPLAYPPSTARLALPASWVEMPTVTRETVGRRTPIIVATFPVWVAYDGAIEAQVAGIDDLVSSVWDAMSNIARPTVARPSEMTVNGRRYRATVVTVDVHADAVTLCRVEPDAVPIPSELVEVPSNG